MRHGRSRVPASLIWMCWPVMVWAIGVVDRGGEHHLVGAQRAHGHPVEGLVVVAGDEGLDHEPATGSQPLGHARHQAALGVGVVDVEQGVVGDEDQGKAGPSGGAANGGSTRRQRRHVPQHRRHPLAAGLGRQARRAWARDASTPTTVTPRAAPCAASGTARRPVPTPSSSTRPPGGTRAARRRTHASVSVTPGVPVVVDVGEAVPVRRDPVALHRPSLHRAPMLRPATMAPVDEPEWAAPDLGAADGPRSSSGAAPASRRAHRRA